MRLKKTRRKLWIMFYTTLILFLVLTSATYAWFQASRTPFVSNMDVYVRSMSGLEISRERETGFSSEINFSEIIEHDTVLKPSTYSFERDCFYGAEFGLEGRINGITYELKDDLNANRADASGYYLHFTFYAKTGTDISVSLADQDGSSGTFVTGVPVWDEENIVHTDGGDGAQLAIRIGFRINVYEEDGSKATETKFIVYEPNADLHADGSTEVKETLGINGSESVVPKENMILQSATVWTETDPVLENTVIYEYGQFLTDSRLFDLNVSQLAEIETYIWLEGQDVDCGPFLGREAKIFANLQFYPTVRRGDMEEVG